jgi:hypothetical protein
MPNSPQETEDFIKDIADAWEESASGAQFGGMTLAQFKTKVKPSLDYRAEIATLEGQLIVARKNRDNADEPSNETCFSVVSGVKSHPDHGENSALYKAMGYVPKNERKSGLVRPSNAVQPAIRWQPDCIEVAHSRIALQRSGSFRRTHSPTKINWLYSSDRTWSRWSAIR